MDTITHQTKMGAMSLRSARWGVVGTVIVILILTVLEFPPPLGFETRPQADVSPLWLILFLLIVIAEIAAIPLVFRRPALGAKFAIAAAILNLIQIVADQLHLMQPEVAPLGYSLLEASVGILSVLLIYFAWKTLQQKPGS